MLVLSGKNTKNFKTSSRFCIFSKNFFLQQIPWTGWYAPTSRARGRSPAKRKNAREPAFVRSGFIFHVCGGQNIFVCFINSFLFVKRFFSRLRTKNFSGKGLSDARRRPKILRFIHFLKGNAYHFGGLNRSKNEGKRGGSVTKGAKFSRGA